MAVSRIREASMAVVGAGAAGNTVARALHRSGMRVACVISRSKQSALRLAEATGADVASDDPGDLLETPDLLVVAVPDDEIQPVVTSLASLDVDWNGCTVVHLSGVLPSTALGPLRRRGAETASFHPMVSLHRNSAADVFAGAWISVEGTGAAVEFARMLGDELGARVVPVDADTKSLIHLAASLASNYFVTLMSMAVEFLSATELDAGSNEPLLRPLVAATLQNIDFRDPAPALTGPISRGDLDTLRGHLHLVREHRREYLTSFTVLAAETVRIAKKANRITDLEAARLLDLLQEFMDEDAFGKSH